jgi:hypothetical protein
LSWLIVRTDARKEAAVAESIRSLGFEAWVPTQMIASRPSISRRVTSKAAVQIRELPVIPKIVFAEMLPIDYYALIDVRHYRGIMRSSDGGIARVSSVVIDRYKSILDAENTAALALVSAKNRKQKAKWRSLQEALIDLVDSAKQLHKGS